MADPVLARMLQGKKWLLGGCLGMEEIQCLRRNFSLRALFAVAN